MEDTISYTNIIENYCSPPFHYYKSWCYYIFPNITLDWLSAYRLCHSIDKFTHLIYISHDDEMIDPLRDILINREKFSNVKSLWTNTTWGQQKRAILSRQGKRSCRKVELKLNFKTGQIDTLRMPFTNCREKHSVMCRKELPLNLTCRRPWALAYGICYYFDEQVRITQTEQEERNILQCQAWNGQLFSSSKQEKTILIPFLSYSLFHLQYRRILFENFGGISYTFESVLQENCSLISGDVYLSSAITQIKSRNQTQTCSSYHSYTFCRQNQNISCEPPWFYDDGFCLYFSSQSFVDMSTATIECSQHGGHLLYINNVYELFRLTHNLVPLVPFFKHRSLAGVWLALSYRAFTSAMDESEDNFDWRWDLSVESYLDDQWRISEWKQYFQHRLSPYVVSAGDCAALILDTKILEPIERTSCHNQRTVVCRKPIGNEKKSFHKKVNYEKFLRLQNSMEIISETSQRKLTNTTSSSSSTFTILRHRFEPLNTTTYRLIIYLNGSTTQTFTFVFTCQSKVIVFEKMISPNDLSSILHFDIPILGIQNEYELLFHYLQTSNCSNTTTNQCISISCLEYDPWHYSIPEMQNRLEKMRNQSSTNQYCLTRYPNSKFEIQICTLLIDQFRIRETNILTPSSSSIQTNECKDYGGQCIPELLIGKSSIQFQDKNLYCPTGYICWLQGERCSTNSYCIDRVRYPCSLTSHLTNITCSNSHHDCCSSYLPSLELALHLSPTDTLQTWNILLPIYYFSFHGTSKWDKFFFNSWLQMGSDLSHDFINDEFLFSCTGIFVDSLTILTHESCLPTHLTSEDKRSILFSLIKKQDDFDEYEKVALHIQTYQIYSPFQLVRLAYRHEAFANKTFRKFNLIRLNQDDLQDLFCAIVFNEKHTKQIRLINSFERQFIFTDNIALFAFIHSNTTENEDVEDEWTFSPVACVLDEKLSDWTIVGISGKQLKHKCKIINYIKYCQMTFVYLSEWF